MVALTAAPPPKADAVFWLLANNCEPFTASVLVPFKAPAATLVNFTEVPAGLKVT